MLLLGMEKFRIGLYGFAQTTAIAYGVLASGAVVKVSHSPEELQANPFLNGGVIYRDYGFYLLLLVLAWAVISAYRSSEWAKNRIDEDDITGSGLGLTILYAILGTFFAFSGAFPQHVLVGHP
jgi:hypothetical protein